MSSAEWPPITDPSLLARWRATDDELPTMLGDFFEVLTARMAPDSMTPRPELAYTYPFGRPEGTVLLDGTGQREPTPDEIAEYTEGRHPVLAIGANGSPRRLAEKLHAVDDRTALLTPATVEGIDICALPMPAGYGSFAAGIAASPGTTVEAVIVDHTAEQLEWLAITEFTYRLVRLEDAVVRTADGRVLRDVLAFVQRMGLYAIDGEPVPLAAIPATGRRWNARTQRELMADCARRCGIAGGDPDALVAELFADQAGWMQTHYSGLVAQQVTGRAPAYVEYPV